MCIRDSINEVLDKAISYKNEKHDIEASTYIQDNLFDGIFEDEIRTGPDGEEYAFEIISMLRDGFNDFILNTPGKLKYRDVTEEENIGRLNYRKACLLYTSPSPRDRTRSRMPSSA
eukprot:TRINITY_DN16852_c0_g1_i1.p1 TRINITY_DN16852_c0_g1~~TRINITY_DN16852_c0_g1_i1.p1  ORF type:complete len:116 (-),score=22.45 TRINITY_DN16852_c0_g1_i1:139-486(-)